MKDTFTTTETIAISLVVIMVIVAIIASISTWINFVTGFDMVGAGVEMVGDAIYQLKN